MKRQRRAALSTIVLLSCVVAFLLPPSVYSQQPGNAGEAVTLKDPYAQLDLRDILSKIFKKHSEDKKEEKQKKVSFFLIPVIGSNPSMGTSIGAAFSAVGYRKSEEENVSSMLASVTYTSKSFLIFNARSDMTVKDGLHLLGDWRFYNYRERTYGLGSATIDDIYQDYDYKWFRLKEAALLPVRRDLEIGVDYDLDAHFDIQPAAEAGAGGTPVVPQSDKTISSGLGPAFIYDSTDNRVNASRGVYIDGRYRFFSKWLGSDENWQLLDLEARWYKRLPFRRRQVIGFWGLTQIVTSGTAPYFDQPASAWDTYGRTTRGYTAGRFRGTGWLYGEVEYRTDLTKNGILGGVLFLNASSFSADDRHAFNSWVIAGGLGMRFKVDKRTGSNVAIDLGFGQDGSRGVYLAFNEAF